MVRYIAKKIFIMIVVLWVIITSIFFMIKLLPGSPFDKKQEMPINVQRMLEIKYEFDKPLVVQYIKYIKSIIRFDFGVSYREVGVKVTTIIRRAFKYSAIIGLSSMCISIFGGLVLGIFSAISGNIVNKLIMFGSNIGIAAPNFILAVFCVYLFGYKWKVLSVGNIDYWGNYIGPILILSIYPMAFLTKMVNVSLTKTLKMPYIDILKSYGVSDKKVLLKYSLREVLLPVITYISQMVASIVMGSFAVEKVFSIPGLGKIFIDSVINRDYYVFLGLMLFYVSVYLISVFVADVCYVIIDPRIKSDITI